MKRSLVCVALGMGLLLVFAGCATAYMPLSAVPDAQELGQISTSFQTDEGVIGYGGFLYMASLGLAGGGGALMVAGITAREPAVIGVGGGAAAVGVASGFVLDLVNRPRVARANAASREALLTAARQNHPDENVDVRDVRFTRVRTAQGLYTINATGVVIREGAQ